MRFFNIDFDSECLHFALNNDDKKLISEYFDFIDLIVKSQGFHINLITTLIEALYQSVMLIHNKIIPVESAHLTRKDILMSKFLILVKQYSITKRNIEFYARELCVSGCYLSILIKQHSGHSVMYWVNRSLIYKAKIALQYSEKNINDIAEELNFSNTSFFCKFFKKATGITPNQYRQGTV